MKIFSLFFVKPLNLPGVANNVQQLNINPLMQGSIKGQALHCIRGDGGYFVFFPASVNKGWHHIPDAFIQSVRCEPWSHYLDGAGVHLDGTPITEEERKAQREKYQEEAHPLGKSYEQALADGDCGVVQSVEQPPLKRQAEGSSPSPASNEGVSESSPAALASVPESALPSPSKPAGPVAPCSKCLVDSDHPGECDPLVKKTISFSEAIEAVPAMMKQIAEEDAGVGPLSGVTDYEQAKAAKTSGAPKTKKSNKHASA